MPAYQSIDHVMLRLHAAEPLFDLLTHTFALPTAWPLQHSAFATYGWVHVGNTDLELWAAASNTDLPHHAQPPLFHGFALEPALPMSDALAHLAASGIACKPARAFQTPDAQGNTVTNFTNSVVLDLSSPSCCVFLCEWNAHASIYPWAQAITPVARRASLHQSLMDSGGGPLGLLGLRSIRVGTPSLAEHLARWQSLSGSENHPVQLTPEIALELVPADHLQIESLTFEVRSLEVSRRLLKRLKLLYADSGNTLTVSKEGLVVDFVEVASHRQGC